MKVTFTTAASDDLREIARHIALDSPRYAITVIRDLRASARGIADAPRGYPLVSHFESHGLRRRVAGSYIIFFRIREDRISIIRILHGARDYERILSRP